jgi:hypothetical protein
VNGKIEQMGSWVKINGEMAVARWLERGILKLQEEGVLETEMVEPGLLAIKDSIQIQLAGAAPGSGALHSFHHLSTTHSCVRKSHMHSR